MDRLPLDDDDGDGDDDDANDVDDDDDDDDAWKRTLAQFLQKKFSRVFVWMQPRLPKENFEGNPGQCKQRRLWFELKDWPMNKLDAEG